MKAENVLLMASNSDLGENAYKMAEFLSDKRDSVFVDIGVRDGYSSGILAIAAAERNNKVYGVDVNFNAFNTELVDNNRYLQLEGDSSTIGKYVEIDDLNKVDFLFVDSLHTREQVLCELYYWVPRMTEGATVAFHDSHWPAGKKDTSGGREWNRVDDAIREFFGLNELKNIDTEEISVRCHPASWGMTFVTMHNPKVFENHVTDWESVFKIRNELIACFWDENSVGNRTIELEMHP